MKPVPDIHAEFMFSLLDYQTWNLYCNDHFVGQITLNHLDRSVMLALAEFEDDPWRLRQLRSYSRWRAWLGQHLRDKS